MLTLRSFPLRNARFHWRSNVPVALGVAIGTAVLVGALVVGDSLRGSLRARAERQLNGVEASYVGPKLVRADIAKQLPGEVAPGLGGAVSLQTLERLKARIIAGGANNQLADAAAADHPAVEVSRGEAQFHVRHPKRNRPRSHGSGR